MIGASKVPWNDCPSLALALLRFSVIRTGSCAPAGMAAAEADATKIKIAQSADIAVNGRFIWSPFQPEPLGFAGGTWP
jgi:hypothetical protein